MIGDRVRSWSRSASEFGLDAPPEDIGRSRCFRCKCSRYVAAGIGVSALILIIASVSAVVLMNRDRRSAKPSDPTGCGCANVGLAQKDVVLYLTASIRNYPIKNTVHGDVMYRTRTWCDGSPNASECESMGIFGPTLVVRPGDRIRIIVRNELDEKEARALGPNPPTLDAWFQLANNVSGRYAGLQDCGFSFTGKYPDRAEDFTRDATNMPGHRVSQFEGTNIHLHGMEIPPHLFSPLGTSDPSAEMIHTRPGECQCYDFDISKDHPAGGTYWYHPHLHSSAAIQSWSGMAGLIKVIGDLDDTLPNLGVQQDIPFAIWDPHFRMLDDSDGVRETNLNSRMKRRVLLGPRESLGTDYFLKAQTDQSIIWYLVNGEYQPTFRLRPGETARLRVLCATTENLAGFEIVDSDGNVVPFWRIGSDGVVYKKPVQHSRLVLSGGMREEILVRFEKEGRYSIQSRGLEKVQFFCTGPDNQTLAYLEVSGDTWPKTFDVATLPLRPTKIPIQPEEIVATRYVVLAMKADRSRVPFPQFLQNGKPYNLSAIEFNVKTGTAEEWIILNPDRTMHPFHVHQSPFQVKAIQSGYMQDNPAMQEVTRLDPTLDNWRDTVTVPAQGSVKVWIRWLDFKGKSVAHCHFLAHEDTGMLMNILME
mmetsp:Transcript_14373/g.23495  ORF Transcript_14373/g.23495 Transcript_14373/m.23495 type:complete len:648 (+) Transcript_14373:59-2002(+)